MALVRPVEDEEKLRNLVHLEYEELRSEFRHGFEFMRKSIFEQSPVKTLFNKTLNGSMLVQLAQTYVEAMNHGKVRQSFPYVVF